MDFRAQTNEGCQGATLNLIQDSLEETEFRALAQFASPGFFAVAPLKESMSCIAKAVRNSRNVAAVKRVHQEV